jgi:pimeloyl-ACP methyl ester carboxylesterase
MNDQLTAAVHLDVTPLQALVDEPVAIRITGLAPGQVVKLWAHARDANDEDWASSASFVADSEGQIDVAAQQPVTGSYRKADQMGLFWSMRPVNRTSPALFLTRPQKPVEIELIAEMNGTAIGGVRLERFFAALGVIGEPVHEQGLVGAFYHPAGPGSYPAIIILSGSDGTIRENQAALLASHGFAALTLRYFGAEGLPKNLVHIPLEYFETAIHWLQAQSIVNGEKLGVIGLSRGGELALLLGATFPAIKAVVACSPSGLVQAGIERGYARSAWTYHGKPLQQAVVRWTPFLWFRLMWQFIRQQAFPMRDMFLTTLKDRKHLEEATIPVENIQGPILLISGDDDMMFPSTLFSELIMRRLAEHHHPYPDQHLHYPGAGHFVSFPYGFPGLPPFVKRVQGMAVGGSVEDTATSVADSWPKILAFFEG